MKFIKSLVCFTIVLFILLFATTVDILGEETHYKSNAETSFYGTYEEENSISESSDNAQKSTGNNLSTNYTLPKTGDSTESSLIILGVSIFLVVGFNYLYNRKKKSL